MDMKSFRIHLSRRKRGALVIYCPCGRFVLKKYSILSILPILLILSIFMILSGRKAGEGPDPPGGPSSSGRRRDGLSPN